MRRKQKIKTQATENMGYEKCNEFSMTGLNLFLHLIKNATSQTNLINAIATLPISECFNVTK